VLHLTSVGHISPPTQAGRTALSAAAPAQRKAVAILAGLAADRKPCARAVAGGVIIATGRLAAAELDRRLSTC
jgi:hypothetical protein